MNRLDLYRARYRRWRSSPGTPEWHRAVADIREHAGDRFEAAVHRFFASLKETLKPFAEMMGELADAVASEGGPILGAQQVSKGARR